MADEENDDLLELEDGDYDEGDVVDDAETGTPGVESSSTTLRERMRQQLADDVARFLASGGKIRVIENNMAADGPVKPEVSYGNQPL